MFNMTGMDYTIQFADKFAHIKLSQYHNRFREIFESLLNTVMQDIPVGDDQVHFVPRWPLLEPPFLFLSCNVNNLQLSRF